MKSTMLTNARFKSIILFLGSALISLSLTLFLSAMTLRDFGHPGQETFFNGRSSILIVIAFALLGGLALALLIVVVWFLSRVVSKPPSVKTQSHGKGLGKSVPIAALVGTGNHTGNPEQRNALEALRDKSAQIPIDAAGELRTSIVAIQEELEDMVEDEDPSGKAHRQSLLEETDSFKKIIDGMERLSQAQTLARSLRRESLDLEPLLKIAVEKTRNTAHSRDVMFTLECEQGLTMTADADNHGKPLKQCCQGCGACRKRSPDCDAAW